MTRFHSGGYYAARSGMVHVVGMAKSDYAISPAHYQTLSKRAIEIGKFRDDIIRCLRRTNEPMRCRQIASYLIKTGWRHENMIAKVASHLGSLRAQGRVKMRNFGTGKLVYAPLRFGSVEETQSAWMLPDCPYETIREVRERIRNGGKFKMPMIASPRTDDMRQMLDDLRSTKY